VLYEKLRTEGVEKELLVPRDVAAEEIGISPHGAVKVSTEAQVFAVPTSHKILE